MKGAKRKPRRYEEPIREVWKWYPGARSTTKYGCPAYAVKGKVFIFFYGNHEAYYGVLRLPRRVVREMIKAGIGSPFRNRTGICHEWLVLEFYPDYAHSDEYGAAYAYCLQACYWYTLGQKPPQFWVYGRGY